VVKKAPGKTRVPVRTPNTWSVGNGAENTWLIGNNQSVHAVGDYDAEPVCEHMTSLWTQHQQISNN